MAHAEAMKGEETFRRAALCVDLDDSLLKTDLFVESILVVVRRNPLVAFLLPWWILKGVAHLKRQVALRTLLDVSRLPVRHELLEIIEGYRNNGHRIFLATGSDGLLAHPLAARLKVFDGLFASDGRQNLKGRKKRDLLVEQFGEKGFVYAGDSWADLPVWRAAARAIIVSDSKRLNRRVRETTPVVAQIGLKRNLFATIAQELRFQQWVKNLLVFVPLIGAHKIADLELVLDASLAFLSLSLCSSAVYVINDLADLQDDRAHPVKKSRPLASGALSAIWGLALFPVLLALSLGVGLILPWRFLAVLGAYVVATTAYSWVLKKQLVLDVVILALLYTLRVFAGEAATGIPVSEWLLAFSTFIFLSLALAKRYAELLRLEAEEQCRAAGRPYLVGDRLLLGGLGGASGYLAVIILTLYINSESVLVSYDHPRLLWLAIPPFLYWITRLWILAGRGTVTEDPLVFAFNDRPTYLVALIVAAALFLASGSWTRWLG